MKEIIKCFVVSLVLIGGLFLVAKVLLIGLDKSDRVECHKLLRQSEEYPLFFLTQNQKDMCDYLKIPIDAPVR